MRPSFANRLRERGVVRVALSYGVIAWLVLQIADVTFDPLGVPRWVMVALIAIAAVGFPAAILLAWFFEITPKGVVLDTQPEGAPRLHATGLRRYADVLIISLLLAIIAVLLLRDRPWESTPPSIAVLPFRDTSALPEQGYFSDGLAEGVVDQLAHVPGLRVAASGSSFSIRQQDADPRAVATRLGVGHVLSGSAGRAGGRITLTVELIDGTSGARLWSERYERPASDAFALQYAVVKAIVAQLLPDAQAPPEPKPPTANLGAWDLYLQGRTAQTRRAHEKVQESVTLFERAIALDPNYALAWAGKANSLALMAGWRQPGAEKNEIFARAEAAARRALEIDPGLSEAHEALGNLLSYTGEQEDAEVEYKRALELNPNNALVMHDYSRMLAEVNRHDEAQRILARALELDPLHVAANGNYVNGFRLRGDLAGYERAADTLLVRFADDPAALERFTIGLINNNGDAERGIRAGRRWMQLTPAGQPRHAALQIAIGLMYLGDFTGAERMLDFAADGPHAADLDQGIHELRIDNAAARGDYEAAHRLLEATTGPVCERDTASAEDTESDRNALLGFWLAQQGRYAEALPHIEAARPIETRNFGGPAGCNVDWLGGAAVATFVATGQGARAEALATTRRAALEQILRNNAYDQGALGLLAALDAAQGQREAALALLRRGEKAVPFFDAFLPYLPWFAVLAGTPGYDELVEQHERKRKDILARLAKDYLPPG